MEKKTAFNLLGERLLGRGWQLDDLHKYGGVAEDDPTTYIKEYGDVLAILHVAENIRHLELGGEYGVLWVDTEYLNGCDKVYGKYELEEMIEVINNVEQELYDNKFSFSRRHFKDTKRYLGNLETRSKSGLKAIEIRDVTEYYPAYLNNVRDVNYND